MQKADWERAKQMLARPWPYGRVTLEIDGYEVTLVREPVNDMFHNGIRVYVDGKFDGKWFVQDCEERRRFMAQRVRPVLGRAQIARYNKMPKRMQKELRGLREQTCVEFATHWTSWGALVKHLEANNKNIQLKEEN